MNIRRSDLEVLFEEWASRLGALENRCEDIMAELHRAQVQVYKLRAALLGPGEGYPWSQWQPEPAPVRDEGAHGEALLAEWEPAYLPPASER